MYCTVVVEVDDACTMIVGVGNVLCGVESAVGETRSVAELIEVRGGHMVDRNVFDTVFDEKVRRRWSQFAG